MILDIFLLILGFIILIWSANKLVDGSASLAHRFNVSNTVIGLTVVALGTSTPELIISSISAYQGQSAIAIGNVLGSNIFNILFIIGITAFISNMPVKRQTTLFEIPFTLISAVLILIFFYIGSTPNSISRVEGIVLLIGFCIFAFYISRIISKHSDTAGNDEVNVKNYHWGIAVIWIVVGLGGLVFGGQLLVDKAVIIASALGISERVIALTIISVGTSLPELVTSLVAAFKKNTDMAIGNVIGSCIFNAFFILGVASVISPMNLNYEIITDIIVNILSCSLLFLFIFTGKGRQIEHWEGLLMMIVFIGYILVLLFK